MPTKSMKALVKSLNKNELRDLISIAQEVLSNLFNSDEIKDNIKESRFSKGYECPTCQWKEVNKNGKSRGRQRGKGKYDKKKRGISKEQICIESAIDRKGNIIMGTVCKGRITKNEIVNFFDGKIGKDATFCTDSHKSYPKIDKELKVNLKQVPRGKQMIDSVYHLQHINALHSGFKRWIQVFNGVSSKYLNNYLAWFKFLQISKKNKKSDRIKDMLVNVATKETYITRYTIKNRFIELT
jgi:transposase-like protein